ncbi:MAG: hypothetical protein IJ315_03565 [Firmicutes bacterium]|nr:hypothetical protein [Bacillota bacterium]
MKKRQWNLWAYGLTITVLIVMAGFQLNSFLGLWSRRGSDMQFSYYSTRVQELDQEVGMIRPLRIYASSGEQPGRMSLVSDQTAHYIDLYEASWSFLLEALDPSTEVETVDIGEWSDKPVCRYTYDVTLNTQMLGEKTGWFYSDSFQFQEILMLPSQSIREKACIYLLNYSTGKALQITSEVVQWQSEVNSRLIEKMKEICTALGEHYISGSYAYPGYFGHNLYLRDQNEYESWTPWSIGESSEYNEISCRDAAERFFERPELMRSEFYGQQVWIFTDDSCSVRVKENQVLDYVRTPLAASKKISLVEAYDVAFAFLLADMLQEDIMVGTYLDGYEITENGYRFYWNYKVEDRAVQPDEEILSAESMSYAVEMEVRGNQVYRYRRWRMLPKYKNYQIQVLQEGCLGVLNRTGLKNCESLEKVCRIEEGQAVLYWKMTANGETYYEKVQ